MRIEIRNDSVTLDGYVNAVGRDSNPVITPIGRCVEQIEPRAFEKALSRASNVDLLLNHDKMRKLGSTSEKSLELFEDNIGLRAVCTLTDGEVIEKAKAKKLRGWSFGMKVIQEKTEERAETLPRRHVRELDLLEVSLIDDRMSPCYAGTLVELRAGGEVVTEQRGCLYDNIVTVDNSVKGTADYTEFDNTVKRLKKQ